MRKTMLQIGAFSMAIAVIAGALGAHALKEILSPDQLESFKTGVRYHAWHSLALILIQLIPENMLSDKSRSRASYLFLSGILLFSFSIYLLSLRDVLSLGSFAKVLGPITPVGGLFLIAAWILTGLSIRTSSQKQ
jgi:uncharacterized membrane protein YgdD (TMEM256/DUF423 family)